ncbi:prolyl oligopeptidase family serine peptidase [Hyunsoonleella pacifica]|uniref:prolyl oligopeptidase n=1 Tax=Hyunsoonleella pacifica TaxID=1080224 RepID=A0A4Q9FJL3_9FLAO|nr:prolyl oligopeptidase family serine peptidase [Hyunsoonleella pacifica]TBN13131.1 prolyl oligopeptidase [Hyunsoonleella pacifica]GGD28433.1 prolyl oligopeptidase [Hyunsoonleella pacifica]
MKKLLITLSLLSIVGCIKKNNFYKNYPSPKIRKEPTFEKYFSTTVNDSYRNLEDIKDSLVDNWYRSQNIFAKTILDNIEGRDDLARELYKVSNRKSFKTKRINVTSNSKYFFLKKEADESYYKLYYKENSLSDAVILLDPKKLNINNRNDYVINYIKPSWNGKYVAVSLTYSGRDLSDLVVLDVTNKKLLPQILINAWPTSFLGINWLPDNSGFTYLRFQDTDITKPKFKQNSQSVLHLLKDKNGKVDYIFGNKTHSKLNISETIYPTTKIHSEKDKYIIGYLSEVDNYWKAYYANIVDIKSGNYNWKPLYGKKDKVLTQKGYFIDDKFIFLSAKDADNKKIMSVNTSELNFDEAITLVNEKPEEVIDDFEITKDAIFYSTLKYGVDANLYRLVDGKEEKLKTPKKAGRISLSNKSPYSSDLWVAIEGWTSPYIEYFYNIKSNTFSKHNLSSNIEYPEFNNIIAEEVLIKAHDGEEIPLSIIRNIDFNKNHNAPVFLYSYGAYGDIESPYFSSLMLSFVKRGGIYAIAHVRGGGEKGDKWHKGGYKSTKSNSWKDLISCSEYLVEEKLTTKDKITLYGASAGGITVGRAMIERPDLFKVVISQYGYLNPFRGEVIGSAGTNSEEFGSAKDSLECLSLIKMDPYLNLKKNVDYPAVYLTTGMNDPQVQPWMSGKFVAKLQSNNKLKNPVLLLADYETGHGDNPDELKVYKDWANIFSFIFWQTGHPDYQLK